MTKAKGHEGSVQDHVSVTAELEEVCSALEGARILTDTEAVYGCARREDAEVAPIAVAAILNLSVARLKLLVHGIRHPAHARLLAASHNRAGSDISRWEDGDVRLPGDTGSR